MVMCDSHRDDTNDVEAVQRSQSYIASICWTSRCARSLAVAVPQRTGREGRKEGMGGWIERRDELTNKTKKERAKQAYLQADG